MAFNPFLTSEIQTGAAVAKMDQAEMAVLVSSSLDI